MGILLNDEQQLLQDQVRSLLAERAAPDRLRQLITANAPWDPKLWTALAELGVLGAGIPEEYGGVGLGPVEVGVLAQEMGRAVAPAPFFSSICLAAEALMIAGTPAQKAKWLPQLASGQAVGTLAWTEGATAPSVKLIDAKFENGKLNGRKTPVPDAEIAQICIVVALSSGSPVLTLVELDAPGISLTALKSIDQLRHQSRIDFVDAPAELMDGADGREALEMLLNRAAIFEAFEQVGGAEAALLMARDYTLDRYIFGRPLGSFQAVKHSLANIFASWELARCNALGAAKALQDAAPDVPAVAATARIGATRVYETAARENLQFHGGIGFTWEANCHFHYRRARLLAVNIGSTEIWTEKLMAALEVPEAPRKAEVRQEPKAASPAEGVDDAAYRATVRAWLAKHGGPFRLDRDVQLSEDELARRNKSWTKLKSQAGYSGIAHPKEFGGVGGTRRQASIFAQEEAKAGIPGHIGGAAFGQAMGALKEHGTPEQRRKWEALTFSGDINWCQLFSEPAAGSDLAGARTRAVKQGDHWIINGQKVWTSGGHVGDYGVLLARSDWSVPKHAGLSFFIIDMHQPGVTTRPIRQINGHSSFTETFLVDAVVPDENRLDAEGQGWAVAMSVLAHERTTTANMGEGDRRVSPTSARSLIQLAREAKRDHGTAFDNQAIRAKIAQWHVEAQGVKNFTFRLQQILAKGGPPPVNLPVIKLTATNRLQQIYAFRLDLEEAGGAVQEFAEAEDRDKFLDYLTSASSRIAGGADEVLRNQLAERALGMPGDIRADKDVPFEQLRG